MECGPQRRWWATRRRCGWCRKRRRRSWTERRWRSPSRPGHRGAGSSVGCARLSPAGAGVDDAGRPRVRRGDPPNNRTVAGVGLQKSLSLIALPRFSVGGWAVILAHSQVDIRAWRWLLVVCACLIPVEVAARSKSAIEADAQRYYRLGQTQFEQGMTLQAIESLKKAIDMNPKLAEAHDYLGVIYLQQTDPSHAVKYLKKAVEIDPYYTDAHNTLGVAYKELGKFEKALAEFEIALKDRTYATPEKIHLNMGQVFLARGDYPQAIQSFEKALTIKPDYLRG